MAEEKGALTSYLASKKEEDLQNQMKQTVAAAPATPTTKPHIALGSSEPQYSVADLAKIVAPEKFASQRAGKLYAPETDPVQPYSGVSDGVRYGATRGDSFSPAEQNQNAAVITNNPEIQYLGGMTPRGARIAAEYPGEEDTFYLKQKFEPVKSYPLPLPNGQVMDTETTNLNKAMWLYAAASEPASPIDWWGYYKMPDTLKEGPVHAFVRGAVNTIPQISVRGAGFVSTVYADAAEALGRIINNDAMIDYGNSLRNIVYKTTEDLMQDVTWQYGPEGVGDRDANKFWYIGGQAAAYIPLGFMNQMKFLPFLELAEAGDSAMYVRQSLENKGRSFWGSVGRSAEAFAAVYAIGVTPKVVDTVAKATLRPAQGLVKLAKENPERLRHLVRTQRLITAATEMVSEPGQNIVANLIAGDDVEWEDALATLFWSGLISYGTLAATPNDTPERIKARAKAIQEFITTHQEFLDQIVAASGISRENLDMMLRALADPAEAGNLLNYVKEAVVANFDKISDEDKARLNEYIKKLNPDSDLEKEFVKLDERINKLLDDSAAADLEYGGTALTEDQRQLARLMIRGVAANQLARKGILPSEMVLPTRISGSFNMNNVTNQRRRSRYQKNAEGMTNVETGEIIVNNELQGSELPVGQVAMPATTSGNMAPSASVKAEYAAAGVQSPQSVGFAGLSHEFWHWIEAATGLPQVGEFMQGMQQLVQSIVPDMLSGKEGLELSEAYAYAMGYAGDKLKSVLGFEGNVADYIDFMNTTLNAQDIAQGTIDSLKAYMESFRNVIKANREIIDDIVDGFGTAKLKGAINNFVETGNPGALTVDDIRGLNAALNSAVDATTADNLEKVFGNKDKAYSFMNRYAQEYDNLLAKDRGDALENYKKNKEVADAKNGVDKTITPATAMQNTVLSKADEVLSQPTEETKKETPAAKTPAEEKPAEQKQEDNAAKQTPRMHVTGERAGTPYDVDTLVKGGFDNAPDLVVGYLENAAKWAKEVAVTKESLEGRTVNYFFDDQGVPHFTLTPSMGTSIADHRAAYVILAKHKLKQLNQEGKLTPALKKRAKQTHMFAVASKTIDALQQPLEYLSSVASDDAATQDAKNLHTALSRFNQKITNEIYQDFGPHEPLLQAQKAADEALKLYTTLQEIYNSSDDETIKNLIGGYLPGGEKWIQTAIGDKAYNRSITYRPAIDKYGRFYMTTAPNLDRTLIEVVADYYDELVRFIENEENDIERDYSLDDAYNARNKMSRSERRAIGILKSKKTSGARKYRARVLLGEIGTRGNDPLDRYFSPDYNAEYSDDYIDVKTISIAEAFAYDKTAPVEEKQKAAAFAESGRKQSRYVNAISGYLKRDIINTPTPLEELGISMEQAEAEIRAAGLEPYNFMENDGTVTDVAKQLLSKGYIRKTLNSNNPNIALKTRRLMLGRLLETVPSIGDSKNRAERMRVLHAIDSAKAAVDQLFASYIDSEESYDNNPTKNPQAFETGREFVKSDPRFERLYKQNLDMGYTEETSAHDLSIGDEVVFPYGNNFVRAVVAFKFKTPSGARGMVLYEDVDIENWRSKDLTTITRPPRQIVASEQNLNDVGVMRKPLENSNPSRFADLAKLYDDVCALHENFVNYRRVAEAAIADAEEDAMVYSLRPESVVEGEEVSEYDADDEANMYTEMFAVASNTPEIDPGALALTDQDFDNLSVYEKTEEAYMQGLEEGTVTPAQRNYLWQKLQDRQNNKSEDLKQRFSSSQRVKDIESAIVDLRNGISGRKEQLKKTFSRLLLFGGSGTGLDRKGNMYFGDAFTKRFNTKMGASRAQQISEGKRQALDAATMKTVFGDSRQKFERWLVKKTTDKFDAVLYNDTRVKITRGEIIGIAMTKAAVERGLIDTANYTNEYERMRKFYKNVDELLGYLTEEDQKFINVGLHAIADARGTDVQIPTRKQYITRPDGKTYATTEYLVGEDFDITRGAGMMPAYWVPSVLGTDYLANGWDSRPVGTPDNSFAVISSQEALAAPDAYDAIVSLIGSRAMKESHLVDELQLLHDVLLFKDIDRSQFKQFDEKDMALYTRLINESAMLRQEMEDALGKNLSRWFVENIKTDLKYNPALKEFTVNPVLGTFQKVTRTVASSLLMLSPKQGLVNLGNYHLFLGLSNSGQLKFYTADWANAIAHFREAWALALENPEFKRRLEQSGLSEQMRRVADTRENSLLRDLEVALREHNKEGTADVVGTMNTISKIATKYGLATNVLPDFIGIALGNYAVYNDVLTRNSGNVAKTQQEIANFILNRVSSSNYQTRSAATKTLQKMGLEALVLFQNDQLQKIGMICEAGIDLMTSDDPVVRKRAWKDIQAATYSTLRYVAIQAGWLAAIIRVLTGVDLSDKEKEYLYESTLRETIAQIGGSTQLGAMITPVLNGLVFGRDMGISFAPYGSLQRAATSARKGDWARALGEVGALTGIAPIAPASVRILDAMWKMASDDDKEFMVGLLMLGGRSPATSEKMLGLTRGQKTGKLKPKKSNKKKDE